MRNQSSSWEETFSHPTVNNPYGDDKVLDACSIIGIMDLRGRVFDCQDIMEAMSGMRERVNGLGSGFAVYGIYPKYRDSYALHLMYEGREALEWGSRFIESSFEVLHEEEIPTDRVRGVRRQPIMWRYFVDVKGELLDGITVEDYVVEKVMEINTSQRGAYVLSSGRNMGVFKGVGWPEDIVALFRLDEYRGYLWMAHGRFPTNSPGWWGGAHPFSLLDFSVVHNGELSSYGTNRRFLEMYGYRCVFQTDTEVLTLAIDLLMRRQNLPVEVVAKIFAPPFWGEIDSMPPREQSLLRSLRVVYGSLLMNGPFTIVFAQHGMMVGLADRIKLRPLTAAKKGDRFFLSSEEGAVRRVYPDLDYVWHPRGGEPVIARCGSTLPAEMGLKERRYVEELPPTRV